MALHPGHWWTKVRHLAVIGILMVFLFVLDSIIGCDTDEEPQVYYGPPPADDSQEGNDGLDLDAVVYYGPQPFDTVDVVGDVPDPSDTPRVVYGPPPVDVLDVEPTDTTMDLGDIAVDMGLGDVMMDGLQTLYGPPPGFDTVESVDTVPPKDLADDVKDDNLQFFYGPQPGE